MRRFILFTSVLLVLAACSSAPKYSSRAEAIAAQIKDPQSNYVVVACHRGDWRNWPENSLPAIESVIAMGADIVEIDVHMTADSVLVLCHDKDVKRTTNFNRYCRKNGLEGKSAKVCDLTLEEIKSLSLKRAHQAATIDTLRMPTLKEALACTKDRICVNIDKGYDYYDQVMAIAEELGVTDQILIKGTRPIEVVAENEARYAHNVLYMPIVSTGGNALLQSYLDSGTVPVAYELCWGAGDSEEVFAADCKKIVDQGSKVWLNTLWSSLCGGDGHDDDAAYQAKDPGEVYGFYLKSGVSMIQTDRPQLLIGWLKKQGRHSLPR